MRFRWMRLARSLSALAVVSCLALPASAEAQSAPPLRRIAVLGNQDNPPWEGFRQGLRELGYGEGRNVVIEWRWSGGFPERLPALARELVALEPAVLVVSGSQAALAAKAATQTIPIVAAIAQHPEELDLATSLARPGGNVTGLSTYSPQLTAKKLELLAEVVPGVSRVALLWNPASESERLQVRGVMQAAAAAGVTIHSIGLQSPEHLAQALAEVRASRAQALMAIGNPITFRARSQIADFAVKQRLPTFFEEGLFVEVGGLMSYGPNFNDLFRRAATYVDKILKGAAPADLPIEQPTRFELVVNRGTAARLGLHVPPAVMLQADRVIE